MEFVLTHFSGVGGVPVLRNLSVVPVDFHLQIFLAVGLEGHLRLEDYIDILVNVAVALRIVLVFVLDGSCEFVSLSSLLVPCTIELLNVSVGNLIGDDGGLSVDVTGFVGLHFECTNVVGGLTGNPLAILEFVLLEVLLSVANGILIIVLEEVCTIETEELIDVVLSLDPLRGIDGEASRSDVRAFVLILLRISVVVNLDPRTRFFGLRSNGILHDFDTDVTIVEDVTILVNERHANNRRTAYSLQSVLTDEVSNLRIVRVNLLVSSTVLTRQLRTEGNTIFEDSGVSRLVSLVFTQNQSREFELVTETELLEFLSGHSLVLAIERCPVSFNQLGEVEGLLVVHDVLCVGLSLRIVVVLGERHCFVNSCHHVVVQFANAAVGIHLTRSIGVGSLVDVGDAEIGHLVSEERSVVRGNGGVLTSLVQRNLRSKDGNHRLILTCSPIVFNNSLDLLGILHVDLDFQLAILHFPILHRETSISLLSRTGVLIPLVARENFHFREVVNIDIRRVEVVLCPKVFDQSNLGGVVAVVQRASASSSEVNVLLFRVVVVAALLLNVPLSFGNIVVLESFQIVEAGSLDAVVVSLGDEHQAAEAVLHEHVQNVHLCLQSVNLLRESLEVALQGLDVVFSGRHAIFQSVNLILQSLLGIVNLLLEFSLVGSLQIVGFDSLDALLKIFQSNLLLCEVGFNSLAGNDFVFQTLLQHFDALESITEVGLNGFEFAIDVGNLLVELALVNLVVLQVNNQGIDVLDSLLGSSHASFEGSNLGCVVSNLSLQLFNCSGVLVNIGTKTVDCRLVGSNLSLCGLDATLQSSNLSIELGLGLVQSVQIVRDLILQVLDVIIVVLAGRQRRGSNYECSQHQKA